MLDKKTNNICQAKRSCWLFEDTQWNFSISHTHPIMIICQLPLVKVISIVWFLWLKKSTFHHKNKTNYVYYRDCQNNWILVMKYQDNHQKISGSNPIKVISFFFISTKIPVSCQNSPNFRCFESQLYKTEPHYMQSMVSA